MIKNQILDYLRKRKIGATISKISRDLSISRPTVYRYLSELKAEGLIKEIVVGAYKLYIATDKLENELKIISRRLLCALGFTMHRVFGKEGNKLSYRLGYELIDSFEELYPDYLIQISPIEPQTIFDGIKAILEIFLGSEIKIDVIPLNSQRAILNLEGEICNEISTQILVEFLKGAIRRFVKKISGIDIAYVAENIQKIGDCKYRIAIEIKKIK